MGDEFQERTPRLILFELWAVVALFVVPTIGPAIDWNSLYKDPDLQAWQTGIGAVVGLIGLGLVALMNAELNRRRDDRLRRDEARALAGILAAELEHLEREATIFAVTLKQLIDDPETDSKKVSVIEALPLQRQLIYRASATKLGLLGYELAGDVVQTYGIFEDIDGMVEWLLRRFYDEPLSRSLVKMITERVIRASDQTNLIAPKLHAFAKSQRR